VVGAELTGLTMMNVYRFTDDCSA